MPNWLRNLGTWGKKLIALLSQSTSDEFKISVSVPIESTFSPTNTMQPKLQDTITLERSIFTDLSTIGDIFVDGDIFCKSLELSCRKKNSEGYLAIPAGKYELTLSSEPISELEKKFGYSLPLVNNVPGRSGIRIHPANYPSQVKGCIVPGMRVQEDAIFDSKKAFDLLIGEIKKRLKSGKVYISVIGGSHA
jgi:hypothetical protein